MASTTTPTGPTPQPEQVTLPPAKPEPAKPRRAWRRFLGGLVILALLAGIGTLAIFAATSSEAPASKATTTGPISPTVAATTNSGLALFAHPVLNDLGASSANYQVLFAAFSEGLRRSE